MFKWIAGYRTILGVSSAIMGGVALLLNGIQDSIAAGSLAAGSTKMGAGLLGIGTGLVGAGIRWAPEFIALAKILEAPVPGEPKKT